MLERISITLEKELIKAFDKLTSSKNYPNRSEAYRDLVRKALVQKEWDDNSFVVGVITLVYDHHQRQLQDRLTNIQHDYEDTVISTSHVHLNHHNCLEVVIVRGQSKNLREMADRMIGLRGVKDGALTPTSTGKKLI